MQYKYMQYNCGGENNCILSKLIENIYTQTDALSVFIHKNHTEIESFFLLFFCFCFFFFFNLIGFMAQRLSGSYRIGLTNPVYYASTQAARQFRSEGHLA